MDGVVIMTGVIPITAIIMAGVIRIMVAIMVMVAWVIRILVTGIIPAIITIPVRTDA